MKKILPVIGVVASLALGGVAYAVSSTPSDYSQDVAAGQQQLNSDANAKTQADAVKNGENVEGQIDKGQVQVDETVGQQEKDMGDNQGGEAKHGDANDQSPSSDNESDKSDKAGNEAPKSSPNESSDSKAQPEPSGKNGGTN